MLGAEPPGGSPQSSDDEDRGLSFEQIHRKYNDVIHRQFQKFIEDNEAADDLTVEMFVIAHQKFDVPRGPITVKQWLYRLAFDVWTEHFRGRA